MVDIIELDVVIMVTEVRATLSIVMMVGGDDAAQASVTESVQIGAVSDGMVT